jgi:predicted dehydrogenase
VTSPLSVGLIGCGAIARSVHLPVLASISQARVVAIADSDAGALAGAGTLAPSARTFATADELLEHAAVDAVVIALPTAWHADVAVAAFERGMHVYLEKPVAMDLTEGERVLDAWRRSGRVGMMGFNYRRNALYASVARRVQDGEVGTPLAIRSVFSTRANPAGEAARWRDDRATGGGVLLDLASHHIDLVRHITGAEVQRVAAHVRSHRTGQDTATLLLTLSSGTSVEIFVSLSAMEDDRLEIYGDGGRLVVDRYRALDVQRDGVSAHRSPADRVAAMFAQARALPYAATKLRSVGHEPSFRLAMLDFVTAAREGRPITPDIADGYASLSVVVAAEEAARTTRVVDVGPVPRVIEPIAAPDLATAATPASGPSLTVVSITPDSYDTVRRTLAHVRAQTARDDIELLIMAPSRVLLHADEAELAEFRWVRIIEVGAMSATGQVRARAIREASAPVVVFTEDHCFPDPDWAAALIERHREPWAAVGPVIRNANPETMVSWADLLIGYGPWLAPGEGGSASHLPGHNSSYKVAVLREYGDRLDELMEAESVLQWDLRSRGHSLYLETAARVSHTNFAFWSVFVPVQIVNARVFADTRRRGWSPLKRLAFAAGSPLIPIVRLTRTIRDARRAKVPGGLLVRVAPALVIGLALDGLGQMLGYALGADDAARDRLVHYESHRNELPDARTGSETAAAR